MLKVVDPAVPVACWSCSVAHNESTLFCPHCSKIQPPPGTDFFSVFGLSPRLNLDLDSLENDFHRLSRRLHPDRFARAAENEKEWSLAGTALLNDAYRTLKDPITRTEYLLKLHGAEIGEEHSGKNHREGEMGASRIPADLLEEVFDLNMQLEEIRMAHKMGEEEDPALKHGLIHAKEKFENLRLIVDRELRAQWDAWDNGGEPARSASQKTMVALLDRRRYLSNLVRDVTDTLEGKNGTGVFTRRGR
jgi:molecular chaperone HscB